jgi:hypothetical protein
MRFLTALILTGLLAPCGAAAQTASKSQSTATPSTAAPASGGIETEEVKIPAYLQAPPRSLANQPGYMEPAQAYGLLTKIWQSESRVRDLLTLAQPASLEMPPAVLASFNSNLDMLRRNLESLEKSRAQFAGRVDSEYLGFETYAGISAVLPPLDQLAQTVARYNHSSLEAQFNQAWNDMLTMQQSLKPYLAFLLRNHDQIFLVMENNLYGCQNELNYAMRGATGRATPMRNVLPEFKGRRRPPKKPAAAGAGDGASAGPKH